MSSRLVFVVDDDDEVREITQLTLEVTGGWETDGADRGMLALEMMRARRPDVVLLDVMMPEMDGPTTFRAMQGDPLLRDIPVVLLTAKVQAGARQVWDGLGVLGVIAKPFNPTTLVSEVSALVGWTTKDAQTLRRYSPPTSKNA